MDLFHVNKTPYALRYIGGDPEVITNSVLYKSDWYISCNLCHIPNDECNRSVATPCHTA